MSILSTMADATMFVINGFEQLKASTTLGTSGTPEQVEQQMIKRNNTATMTSLMKTMTEYWNDKIGRNEAIGDIAAKLISNKLTAYMEENGHGPLVSKVAGWAASWAGGKILTAMASGILGPDSTQEDASKVLPSGTQLASDPGVLSKIQELLGGGGQGVSAPLGGMGAARGGAPAVG